MEVISIEELLARYNLASRQTLHARFQQLRTKGVTIENVKPGFYSIDILPVMDRYDQFLKAGGNIKLFEVEEPVTVDVVPEPLPVAASNITIDEMVGIVEAIARYLRPQPQGLENLEWLDKAAANNWKLTTAQVANLIGVKPRAGENLTFVWGSFYFLKVGKIGRQSGWVVRRVNPALPKLSVLHQDEIQAG